MPRKTPSSLKWLIDKHARTAGLLQLKRELLERIRQEASACRSDIRALELKLFQVRSVMRLHHIRIEPRHLRVIRPQRRKAILGYGGITRSIFATLRRAQNNTATTTEIVAATLAMMPKRGRDLTGNYVKHRIQVRLCVLAKRGRLLRIPRSHPCQPVVWRLCTPLPTNP